MLQKRFYFQFYEFYLFQLIYPKLYILVEVLLILFFEHYIISNKPYADCFIFNNESINKIKEAVIIEGPEGELNSSEENNPIITDNNPPIIENIIIFFYRNCNNSGH